uniref:Uncharacterized protein n=1 Tax=Ciona savignyi TaxID=51511 RepID=H2ZHV7_CIOSA
MFLSTEKQELKINLVETESNVEQESLISAICLQLSDFCAARLECLSLYIQMYKSTLSSPLHTLCSEVEVLLESYPAKISHDCLKRIQDCVTEELTVLLALLQAGQKISEWNYTGALYDMDEAHEVLVRWKPLVMNHQGSTFRGSFFSFGEKSSTPASGLYLWMEKFFQTLKSRFTFYFYEALSTSGSADELKQILSRVKYDFVTKSMSHIKRNDFQQLLLVLDTKGNDMPPQVGYSFPTLSDSPPTASSAGDYSVVLNLPPACNVQPVFSLINDKMDELKQEKIVYYSSVETSKTYFCAQADQKIFIVLVCGGYRNEKDSNLIVYFNEVLNNLKLKKIALLLKPGNR